MSSEGADRAARSTHHRRLRSIPSIVAMTLFVAACAADDAPRRASVDLDAGAAVVGESPRRVITVESTPDVGTVTLPGRIDGRDPRPVAASEPVRIVELVAVDGDRVEAGEVVLRVAPLRSRVDELELEILDLERERAVELGDEAEIERIDAEIERRLESADASTTPIRSPVDGVVVDLPSAALRAVDVDDVFFRVIGPDDLAAVVRTTPGAVLGSGVGDPVTVALTDRVPVLEVPGSIERRVSETDDVVELRIVFDTDVTVTRGEAAELRVDPTVRLDGARWLPAEVLHRASGATFLLIETDDGLRRVRVTVGRRTDTHVEVVPTGADLAPDDRFVLP